MSKRKPSVWLDVSVPLFTGMAHWPGDPVVSIERFSFLERGDEANVSACSLAVHVGSHMDAPVHYFEGAPGIDAMPLHATVGRARVIAIQDPKMVRVEELVPHRIRKGERILLKTRNSPNAWNQGEFVEDYVYLSTEAAEWLAARKIRTLGVDYLSVGGYRAGNDPAVHRALLEAGVWIIEGLDLTAAPPGSCDLLCLPLRIAGCDGAPARAFIRARTSVSVA